MAKRKFYYRIVDDGGSNRPVRFRSFCRDNQAISLAQARALYRATGKRIELFYAPLTRRICREDARRYGRSMPRSEVSECVCKILGSYDEMPDSVIGGDSDGGGGGDSSRPMWLTKIG